MNLRRSEEAIDYISDLNSPEGHELAVNAQVVDPAGEYAVGEIILQGEHAADIDDCPIIDP